MCALSSHPAGCISLEEFEQMWKLFSSHMNINISDENIRNLARSIDFNKDGKIDFNEFLEAFRLVRQPASWWKDKATVSWMGGYNPLPCFRIQLLTPKCASEPTPKGELFTATDGAIFTLLEVRKSSLSVTFKHWNFFFLVLEKMQTLLIKAALLLISHSILKHNTNKVLPAVSNGLNVGLIQKNVYVIIARFGWLIH